MQRLYRCAISLVLHSQTAILTNYIVAAFGSYYYYKKPAIITHPRLSGSLNNVPLLDPEQCISFRPNIKKSNCLATRDYHPTELHEGEIPAADMFSL